MTDRKRRRTSDRGNRRRSAKVKSRKQRKQNKGRMIFCIAMEMIVVLILVLVVGWNYGMGTQLVEWIEQMRKPVVKELDISGINSPYAVLMQVRGGRVIGEINGDQQMYPASMTKIMTSIVAIENLKDLDQEITLTLDPSAKEYIIDGGYDPVYGARPLKRFLQKNVETMAARFILGGEVHAGSVMVVDTDGNGLTIHTK